MALGNSFKATLFFSLLSMLSMAQTSDPGVKLGKNSLEEVTAEMTLEEKVRLLVGNGLRIPGMAIGPVIGNTEDKVPGAAGTTFAIPRLGIPSIVLADGPAGVRISPIRNNDSTKTYFATGFPVGTLLASTWDTTLVKEVGAAFGNEAREYGIDVLLAPALNIHRNPLGGRNFEYYSEDPFVSGTLAAAFVNGLESMGVGTSIKHFAANNQETNRNTLNTIVSERALREIYLKGFEIAVRKSQPWTVMSSYNYINEKYTSEDFDLLTTILRDEWGFNGLVMTDWFGGINPVEQMKAGNDLLMPGTPQQVERIINAVKNNELDIKIVDLNVERMLNLILKSPSFNNYRHTDSPDLKKHADLARTAAADGMVLLKNEQTLPLKGSKKIALFGNNSYDLVAGGAGSGDVNKAYVISLTDGLAGAGFILDNALKQTYINYIQSEKAKHQKPRRFFDLPPVITEMTVDKKTIDQLATSSDIAILTIGRNSGEFHDRKPEEFYLTDAEKKLISEIDQAFHTNGKKVIIVLNIGGVIEIASWRNQADAILLAWQPGQEGGHAITDILTGRINPSGKLATTFPLKYTDVPSSKNFPGKESPELATVNAIGMKLTPAEVVYEEGIYVGYRYFNTFNVKPAFPFGFGLSYTSFTYGDLRLNPMGGSNVQVSVTITNSGKIAGKETVQLYIGAPGKSMHKPAMELKHFGKTQLLQPGQAQILTFILTANDFASFDTRRSAWVSEPGNYKILIGSSSEDIKKQTTFNLDKEVNTERVNKVMSPKVPIQELKR